MTPASPISTSVHDLVRCVAGATPVSGQGTAAQIEVEGLEGLLHARAVVAGEAATPSGWTQAHKTAAVDNWVKLQALQEALQVLRQRDVEPLVMPGASLLRLYPDAGCRPMDDVDLLAPPGRRAEVVSGLLRAGWSATDRHPDVLAGPHLTVDIHTDLINGDRIRSRRRAGRLDPEQAWSRRRRIDLEGQSVMALCAEDELLYSAAHALRHSYRRLTWLVDLHLQIHARGLEWDRLADLARESGLDRPFVFGMCLLESCGLHLPPPARACLARERPSALTSRLLYWILEARATTCAGEVLWCLGCTRGLDRARLLSEFVFPRPEVLLQVFPRLPRRLAPVGYVLRCGQLAARCTTEVVAAARRKGGRI